MLLGADHWCKQQRLRSRLYTRNMNWSCLQTFSVLLSIQLQRRDSKVLALER